jgi:hypothetical protein
MSRISVKAVTLGGVLDILLTNLVALPVIMVVMAESGVLALPAESQSEAVTAALMERPGLYALMTFLGSTCSVVGGYVAARMARRDAVLHGALSAFLCVAFGLYAMIQNAGPMPLWVHIAFLPLSPLLGALGGRIWQARTNRMSPMPV